MKKLADSRTTKRGAFVALAVTLFSTSASAALVLDRTRIIYPGNAKSISLVVKNENPSSPFLAQSWIEDLQGNKVSTPFAILPPVQRINASQKGLVRLALAGATTLPQDRESAFYFNLREIPPRSDKSNVLQVAVQTKIKAFYRPEAIIPERGAAWQEQVKVSREGKQLRLDNPTPYYISYVGLARLSGKQNKQPLPFKSVMVAPKSATTIAVGEPLGERFILTHINDYGGYIGLTYHCQNGPTCQLEKL